MRKIQRLVQNCLIVAVLLATVGFKVDSHYCPLTQQRTIHFFSQPDCCCVGTTTTNGDNKSCCENLSAYYKVDLQSLEKSSKPEFKIFMHLPGNQVAVYYQVYISPVLRAKEPFYSLPPPKSGRAIGILHQSFLV